MDERANERAKLIEALQDEVRGDLSDGSHPFNARQEEIYFERLELFANRVADFEEALKEAGGEDFDVRQNTAFTDIDLLAAQELVRRHSTDQQIKFTAVSFFPKRRTDGAGIFRHFLEFDVRPLSRRVNAK